MWVNIPGEFEACYVQSVNRLVGERIQVSRPQVILDLSHVSSLDAGAISTITYGRGLLASGSLGFSSWSLRDQADAS